MGLLARAFLAQPHPALQHLEDLSCVAPPVRHCSGWQRGSPLTAFASVEQQLQLPGSQRGCSGGKQISSRRAAGDAAAAFLGTAFLEQPLLGFSSAKASSTYRGAAGFGADRALGIGSGYWCSSGEDDPNQIVTWTGSLKARHRVKGLRISWAYGPGAVKVLTSPDGELFEPASAWTDTERRDVAFQQDIMFGGARNVKAVRIAMRGPQSWRYFGINDAALVAVETEPVSLVSGLTAPTGERCLAAPEDGDLGLEKCLSAKAAGDDREVFRWDGEGHLEHVVDGRCLVAAADEVEAGSGAVGLGSCEGDDAGLIWEMNADAQLKLSKGAGNRCLVPLGKGLAVQDCERAAQSPDARDKWFMTSKADFDKDAGNAMRAVVQ